MRRHLLVIGAQRCGTSFVRAALDAHPDVATARPARPEPKVFISEGSEERDIGWYENTFFGHATSQQMLAEKSTSYLEEPLAAMRAARTLGHAEVLVMLRDPVDRAVSNWRFSTAGGFEERSLHEALEQNLVATRSWDPGASSVSPFAYLERGRYADYLGPWFSAFPETVHVGFFEEMVADPGWMAGLFDSLGLAPLATVRSEAVNQSEGPAPALGDGLAARVRDYFRDSDQSLRSMLGRELPWTAGSRRSSARLSAPHCADGRSGEG